MQLNHARPLLALAAILVATTSQLFAQGGTEGQSPPWVGGPGLIEAWVEPTLGNNALAVINDPTRPFQTLGAAIAALNAAPGLGPTLPGLVHANPGIYSPNTNGEVLPVTMRDFIHVQGVGARDTIVRGTQGSANVVPPTLGSVFTPVDPGDCTCGARSPQEVLVDFTFTTNVQVVEMFDGFTLQGGNIQVYAETEQNSVQGRVSNCVFDMLNQSDVQVGGPSFGVLMVHNWDLGYPGGYRDIQLHVLSNTFAQAWVNAPGTNVQAIASNVAICDVNDPLCGNPFPDPDPSLRGVGNPNIQNNLIRNTTTNGGIALTTSLGIDASDTSAAIGTVVGPTNAFDPTNVGPRDVSGTFCSNIIGVPPVPVINPNSATGGVDPAFVGEYLSFALGLPVTNARDWRLLQDSAMISLGSAPLAGVLAAVNGTSHLVPALIPAMSYDFDGEGYGNPRIQAGALDLGFDEADLLISCGGYSNDSCNVGPPFFPGDGTVAGLGFQLQLMPAGSTYWQANTDITSSPVQGFPGALGGGFFWAFSHQFGQLAPPVFATNNVIGALASQSLIWLNLTPTDPFTNVTLTAQGAPVPAALPYFPLADPTVLHTVSFVVDAGVTQNAPGSYSNQQVYLVGGGTILLSNVQRCRD